MPGSFVISLDLEKHWGVFDHCAPDDAYWPNLLGVSSAVPRLLKTFEDRQIHATWATVGLLFAESRQQQEAWRPKVLPVYARQKLDPYRVNVGPDEKTDPVHFARSLIELIAKTKGQEISTHTFAHIYMAEKGMTDEAISSDLESAKLAASSMGIQIKSIVYPRNQVTSSAIRLLSQAGILCYRGNPTYGPYLARPGDNRYQTRVARLMDAYVGSPSAPTQSWSEVMEPGDMANVRSGHFLRPYSKVFAPFLPIQIQRITRCIEHAAQSGSIYHLWWHPHNFGRHLDRNMEILDQILTEFDRCRSKYGMQSMNMIEAANAARSGGPS